MVERNKPDVGKFMLKNKVRKKEAKAKAKGRVNMPKNGTVGVNAIKGKCNTLNSTHAREIPTRLKIQPRLNLNDY